MESCEAPLEAEAAAPPAPVPAVIAAATDEATAAAEAEVADAATAATEATAAPALTSASLSSPPSPRSTPAPMQTYEEKAPLGQPFTAATSSSPSMGSSGSVGSAQALTLGVDEAAPAARHSVALPPKESVGNAWVLCNGSCVAGPHYPICAITTALFVVPVTSFCVFVAHSALWALPVVALCATALGLLLCTALTDPGIIPKQREPPEPPRPPDGGLQGVPKYCRTCHIFRPPRAAHCHFCNACIMRHDHHCPWTGTCIGARNHCRFVAFLYATTSLIMLTLALSVVDLVLRVRGLPQPSGGTDFHPDFMGKVLAAAEGTHYVSLLLVLFCGMMLCSVGGLASFHTFLCCSGKTTREEIRGTITAAASSQEAPTLLPNTRAFLFEPIPPSLVRELCLSLSASSKYCRPNPGTHSAEDPEDPATEPGLPAR
eukprot:RCo002595